MGADQPNSFYRVAVCALILDESRTKFLVIYNENEHMWELPGGGLDWGEDAQGTIKREIQEEIGLEVTKVADHPAYFFTHQNTKGTWKVAAIFETEVENFEFTPTDECREIKFVDQHDIRDLSVMPRVEILAKIFKPL